MAISFIEVFTSLTQNINKISSRWDFQDALSQFGFWKVKLFKEDGFFDYPFRNLTNTKNDNYSLTYLYEIFPDESFASPIVKIFYLDGICGPLIAINVFNQNVLIQLESKIKDTQKFIYIPDNKVYQERISMNFIYFNYYPNKRLSAVLIASNELFFQNLIYAEKVLEFLS